MMDLYTRPLDMYDSIKLTLTSEQSPGTDFLQHVPRYLQRVTHSTNEHGTFANGYLGNLKVNVTDQRVKIGDDKGNNSICKYYLGDNFKTLSRGDTQKAIEMISDNLHIDISCADVNRFDAAQNLIMTHPEAEYYIQMGRAQYYRRLEQNNGLYYKNQIRQLVFYGKEHEQYIKGQLIPELYRDRHIIRYEIRFLQRLQNQFNRPEIKANLLSEEVFYRDVVNRWKTEYLKIKKINLKLNQMKPTGSTKELLENLAYMSVLEIGQPNILLLIKQWQKSHHIDKIQASRLRATIDNLCSAPPEAGTSNLIVELDTKIKEAAHY